MQLHSGKLNGKQINVSGLDAGFYFIVLDNTHVIKFQKID